MGGDNIDVNKMRLQIQSLSDSNTKLKEILNNNVQDIAALQQGALMDSTTYVLRSQLEMHIQSVEESFESCRKDFKNIKSNQETIMQVQLNLIEDVKRLKNKSFLEKLKNLFS